MFYKCKVCHKYLPAKAYMYQPSRDFYNICRNCVNKTIVEYTKVMKGLNSEGYGK